MRVTAWWVASNRLHTLSRLEVTLKWRGRTYYDYSNNNIQLSSNLWVRNLISRKPAQEKIKLHLALHQPLSSSTLTPCSFCWSTKSVSKHSTFQNVCLHSVAFSHCCRYKSRIKSSRKRDVKKKSKTLNWMWLLNKVRESKGNITNKIRVFFANTHARVHTHTHL